MIQIHPQQMDATSRGGQIDNIRLHYDVDIGTYTGAIINILKSTHTGAIDNTARAYAIFAVLLDGFVSAAVSAQDPYSLFVRDNWTGDFIWNICFDKFWGGTGLTGGRVFAADGRGVIAPGIEVRRSQIDVPASLTNMAGKLRLESSKIGTSYEDTTVSGWTVRYLPNGRVRLSQVGVAVANPSATVTFPLTDALGENPMVTISPATQCKFAVVPLSSSSVTVSHDAGVSVNFNIQAEMAY